MALSFSEYGIQVWNVKKVLIIDSSNNKGVINILPFIVPLIPLLLLLSLEEE